MKWYESRNVDLTQFKSDLIIIRGEGRKKHRIAAYIRKINKDILIGLVPNAGHTANIDQPDIFNKIVDGFLKDTDIVPV